MSDLSFTNWFPWLPSSVDERFNNGWTFGNIYVTQANSRSPEAEREIVGRYSYGRQLGRLTDAVIALAAKAMASHDKDVEPLVEMAKEIDAIKDKSKQHHAAELLAELKEIKRADPKAWAALVKSVEG